jgi:hypothetical protein
MTIWTFDNFSEAMTKFNDIKELFFSNEIGVENIEEKLSLKISCTFKKDKQYGKIKCCENFVIRLG